MVNNDTLTDIFSEVGRRHGYRDVEAMYAAFRDMKVKWTRSYNWISFTVSDYLMDAPDEVTESVADTIFDKIVGNRDAHYNDAVAEWLSSDSFVRKKQPLYVSRCRGLTVSPIGEHRDLKDSYERIMDMGIIDRDPDIYLGWGPAGMHRRSGFSSVLMKVVNFSTVLDDETLPDTLVDYCLYSHLAHIGMGFDPFSVSREEEYAELLKMFPANEEAELLLKQYCIEL